MISHSRVVFFLASVVLLTCLRVWCSVNSNVSGDVCCSVGGVGALQFLSAGIYHTSNPHQRMFLLPLSVCLSVSLASLLPGANACTPTKISLFTFHVSLCIECLKVVIASFV